MESLWPAGILSHVVAVAAAVANAVAVADAADAALAVGQHGVGRLLLRFSANSQRRTSVVYAAILFLMILLMTMLLLERELLVLLLGSIVPHNDTSLSHLDGRPVN